VAGGAINTDDIKMKKKCGQTGFNGGNKKNKVENEDMRARACVCVHGDILSATRKNRRGLKDARRRWYSENASKKYPQNTCQVIIIKNNNNKFTLMQKHTGAFVVMMSSIYAHTRSTCRTRLHKPLSVRKLLLFYYYIYS